MIVSQTKAEIEPILWMTYIAMQYQLILFYVINLINAYAN